MLLEIFPIIKNKNTSDLQKILELKKIFEILPRMPALQYLKTSKISSEFSQESSTQNHHVSVIY